MNELIKKQLEIILNEINTFTLEEKIEALNYVKTELHTISPFNQHPVDCVVWVKAETVVANDYNPNVVATPEMKLLHQSIKLDGYTQPIVTYNLTSAQREVVDGFHRSKIGKDYKDINSKVFGYLPVTTLDKSLEERVGSTIRHNRARGTHQIRSMSSIVLDLTKAGWTDLEICQKIGMELDEVIRLKQITGLMEAFQNHSFSKSWDEFESKYYGEEENQNGKI